MIRNLRYIIANCKNGQKKKGVDFGATVLYENIKHKKPNKLEEYQITTKEFETNFEGYQKLYNLTKKTLLDNETPFILGGDHSISLSTVAATLDILKDDVSIVWVDAHADINTFKTSKTGNLHGMPLSSVFNLMEPIIKSDYKPTFNQLVYLGLRSIDKEEKKILDKHDVLYYEMEDIHKQGIFNICKTINKKTKQNIHLSFDVDALDPNIVCSTGTPVENGMLMLQANHLIQNLKENKNIRCVDFVEYNPRITTNYNKVNNSLSNCLSIINQIVY